MWKYRIGDVVTHREYGFDQLKGVIVQQKLDREVEPDMDEGYPWYVIVWFDTHLNQSPPEIVHGQEPESQLELIESFNPVWNKCTK